MLLKNITDSSNPFRTYYDIDKNNGIKIKHFAVKITIPGNPFVPHKHKHEQEELWYIVSGEGVYTEDGKDHRVAEGDCMHITPWILHGLRTDSEIKWICLG